MQAINSSSNKNHVVSYSCASGALQWSYQTDPSEAVHKPVEAGLEPHCETGHRDKIGPHPAPSPFHSHTHRWQTGQRWWFLEVAQTLCHVSPGLCTLQFCPRAYEVPLDIDNHKVHPISWNCKRLAASWARIVRTCLLSTAANIITYYQS